LIVSLWPGGNEPYEYIVVQRILKESEMRMLLPVLANPSCCKAEVLQASYFCAYAFLLQSLLSEDPQTMVKWDNLVQEYREILRAAKAKESSAG
jgi:hypothetical protein